jgi:hypothetical protein
MANYTFFIDIPEVGGQDRPKTAIYFPPAYGEGKVFNMLLYLHGMDAKPIDEYLQQAVHALREKVTESGKNVVFVAPSMADRQGKKCDAGKLETDPDWYIDKVREAIKKQEGSVAALNGLIIACHSGGGRPIINVVKNLDKYKPRFKEAWGFDCLYGPKGDPGVPWNGKDAKTRPPATSQEMIWANTMNKSFVYYFDGEPTIRARNLELLAKENPSFDVVVTHSNAVSHDAVPKTHLTSRLKGTGWL